MTRRKARLWWWQRLFLRRAVLTSPVEVIRLPDYEYERAGLDVAQLREVLERHVKHLTEAGGVDEGTGDAFDALIETWYREAVEQIQLHHARQQAFAQTLLAAQRSSWAMARADKEQAEESHRGTRAALHRAETHAEAFGRAHLLPLQRWPEPNNELAPDQGPDLRSQTS
jgi:hypothetical protein